MFRVMIVLARRFSVVWKTRQVVTSTLNKVATVCMFVQDFLHVGLSTRRKSRIAQNQAFLFLWEDEIASH